MTTATKDRRITPLSERDEKKVAKAAADVFGEDETLVEAAVVYGRKLLKFSKKLRATSPPVPTALQGRDKKTTKNRCIEIAKALGLDPVAVGLEDAPAE